ncbi:hypothetical protein NIES267_15710 [Calothrix parasitica NIES-267]|uniref:Uncharacterized protein n=1 Tax=Calothrix parasitica NIES-267 TaxID=1973488 RepID=A0A1Z4LLH2_9CYAN|nr:hypothetical protein NIES267_15710 [Calothrix parasitica NIES-267]
MKKVLGLAFLASFIATPVLAGETFVRNEWSNSHSVTKTNLRLDSHTNSHRNEDYASYSKKFYYEGGIKKNAGEDYSSSNSFNESETKEYGSYAPEKKYGSGYSTEHYAGSVLVGSFKEKTYDNVRGTIKTRTYQNSNAHETSAGIR